LIGIEYIRYSGLYGLSMKNRFKDLLISLTDAHVDFIVAGGVACVLHGVERVTLDLDLSLSFSPDSLSAFLKIMQKFGLVPRAPVAAEILADPEARKAIVTTKHAIVFTFQDPKDPFWHVDIFLREDLAYPVLRNSCVQIELDGHHIQMLSIQKLLDLKKAIHPPRPKDQLDISELTRLLQETAE